MGGYILVSDVTPPDQDSRYGHFTFARDSSDVAQWFRRYAGEHGFELDAAQTRALQHFERLYEELIGLERLDASLVRLLARKRAKADYIELARRYHTVLVSGVPRFTVDDEDKLRRFVWLVDEFYDRRVKLLLSAAAALPELFRSAGSADLFQRSLNESLVERLVSRLTEMQAREYLTQPHLP